MWLWFESPHDEPAAIMMLTFRTAILAWCEEAAALDRVVDPIFGRRALIAIEK